MAFAPILDAIARSQSFFFDGISFPIASYSTDFGQDVAQHKKPGRDGARLEATGRTPLVFAARGIFRNGAVFDTSAGTTDALYPTVFRAFMLRCADGSTGDFVHPELGPLRGKCVQLKAGVVSERRDGCDVDFTLLEDIEGDIGDLGTASPLALATFSADSADQALTTLRLKQQGLDRDLKAANIGSFSDSMRQLRGVADSISLVQKRGGAIIPSMIHDADVTRDSLDRLGTSSANTARVALERLKAALYLVQQSMLVTRAVVLYTVPIDSTMGAISQVTKAAMSDLVRLNVAAINSFPPGVVKAGTVIRYYK